MSSPNPDESSNGGDADVSPLPDSDALHWNPFDPATDPLGVGFRWLDQDYTRENQAIFDRLMKDDGGAARVRLYGPVEEAFELLRSELSYEQLAQLSNRDLAEMIVQRLPSELLSQTRRAELYAAVAWTIHDAVKNVANRSCGKKASGAADTIADQAAMSTIAAASRESTQVMSRLAALDRLFGDEDLSGQCFLLAEFAGRDTSEIAELLQLDKREVTIRLQTALAAMSIDS